MDRLLSDGWLRVTGPEQQDLQRELETELPLTNPQPHPLAGMALCVIAAWEGNDDVLVEHADTELLSVMHLSCTGRQERAKHPTTEFTGTYEEFLIWSGVQPGF